MPHFKINVLSNEEFDQLPSEVTRGSDISGSLGFADQRTGQAYVRYTGIPDLNKYLVNHELEELMADESTHEDENGIRHKSFGSIFSRYLGPILQAVSFLAPGSGIANASSALSLFGNSFNAVRGNKQQALPRVQQQPGALGFFGQNQGQGQLQRTAQAPLARTGGQQSSGTLGGNLNSGNINQGLSVASRALNTIRGQNPEQQVAEQLERRVRF